MISAVAVALQSDLVSNPMQNEFSRTLTDGTSTWKGLHTWLSQDEVSNWTAENLGIPSLIVSTESYSTPVEHFEAVLDSTGLTPQDAIE